MFSWFKKALDEHDFETHLRESEGSETKNTLTADHLWLEFFLPVV